MAASHPTSEEFKQLCLQEFAFLMEQFGFSPEPLPTGEIINPVQVRFVSPTTRVRIEGRAWGESIWVSLESRSAIAMKENASDVLRGDFSLFDIVETQRQQLHQRLRDNTAI